MYSLIRIQNIINSILDLKTKEFVWLEIQREIELQTIYDLVSHHRIGEFLVQGKMRSGSAYIQIVRYN
jgi:hypothetical protein